MELQIKGMVIFMERIFTKKDFEELNKLKLYGKLNSSSETELYWFNTIDRDDAAFGQTKMTHHHVFFEIHFILGGRIVYVFGKKRAVAQEGDMIIIPSGIPHAIESYTDDMLKSSIAVKIDENEALYKTLSRKGCLPIKLDKYTEDTIAFCADSAVKSLLFKENLIKNRIFELLCSIAGECEPTSIKSEENIEAAHFDIRLFKAKQFLKDNPSVFIGCDELAKYCNLSSKQLNRIFLKYENITLLQYIHNEKIGQAKKLLTDGKNTVSQMSELLGFSSVYYFSRFFTKHVGISPAEYRKRLSSHS